MRKILFLLVFLSTLFGIPLSTYAANNGPARGFCEIGGRQVVTNGLGSTTRVQQSFPRCVVTVYLAGTQIKATIYSDNAVSPTPLANPFTAHTDGSWIFYASKTNYDVVLSGGDNGGFPVPFTLYGVQIPLVNPDIHTVYITDYGAVCNGSTNDAAALAAANTDLTVLGGNLIIPAGKTCVIGTNETTSQNVTIVFEQSGIFSVSNTVTLVINGPITAQVTTIFTLVGSGKVSLGTNYRLNDVYPEWWGAKADGSTDSATALNNAVLAFDRVIQTNYTSCGTIRLSNGIYLLSSSWTVEAKKSCTVIGSGNSEASGITTGAPSTVLKWNGNGTDPLLRVYGTQYSVFRNFGIQSSASVPLAVAIQLETRSNTTITANRFENFYIQGTNNGGLGYGIKIISGTGGDQNNEFHQFVNGIVSNYVTAAAFINHRQAKLQHFEDFTMGGSSFSQYGIKADLGSFTCNRCGGGSHQQFDFYSGDASDLIQVSNSRFENSQAFLSATGSSNPTPVIVSGVTWSAAATSGIFPRKVINFTANGMLSVHELFIQSGDDKDLTIHLQQNGYGSGAPGNCVSGNVVWTDNIMTTTEVQPFDQDLPNLMSSNLIRRDAGGTFADWEPIHHVNTRWCDLSATALYGLLVNVGDNGISAMSGAPTSLLKLNYGAQTTTAANKFTVGIDGSVYIGNYAGNNLKLTGTPTGARVATFPDASITVPGTVITSCGTANACSATTVSSTSKVVFGKSAALNGASPSIATITGMPAFTGTTTYQCNANPVTASASTTILGVSNVSSSSFTITGPNGATDLVSWTCIGN